MKVTIFGDDGRPATAVNVGKAIKPLKPPKPPKPGGGKKARRKARHKAQAAERKRMNVITKATARMDAQIRQVTAPARAVDEFDRWLAAKASTGDPVARELVFKRGTDAGYRGYLEHLIATASSGEVRSGAAGELARLDTVAEQRAIEARQGGGRQWLAR